LKQGIELAHLARRDGVEGQVAVGHADPLDEPVQGALAVLADLVGRAPEHHHGVFWGPRAEAPRPRAVEELGGPAGHPEHAGVRHHAQAGAVAHVCLEAHCGRVVHADDAVAGVDLGAGVRAQHVAGAGHQRTAPAVQGHALQGAVGGRGRAGDHQWLRMMMIVLLPLISSIFQCQILYLCLLSVVINTSLFKACLMPVS